MPNRKRLVEPAVKAAVVDAYMKGKRVLDIEQEHGIDRATLYWVLEQAGVLPDRAKRGEKLRGNTEQLAMLYDLITRQEEHIDLLEGALRECRRYAPKEMDAAIGQLLDP